MTVNLIDPHQLNERGFRVNMRLPSSHDRESGVIEKGVRRIRCCVRDGRVEIRMRAPTDAELSKLHRIEITPTAPWSRNGHAMKIEGELVAVYHISTSLTDNEPGLNDERVVQGVKNSETSMVKKPLIASRFGYVPVATLTARDLLREAVRPGPADHAYDQDVVNEQAESCLDRVPRYFQVQKLVRRRRGHPGSAWRRVIFRSTAKYFQQFAYGDTGHVHIELMSNKDQVCTAMEAHGSLYCPSRDPKRVPQRLRQRRVVREQRGAVADETLWYTSAHVGSLSRVPELGGAFR